MALERPNPNSSFQEHATRVSSERGKLIPFPIPSPEPAVPKPFAFFTTPDEEQAHFERVGEIYFKKDKDSTLGDMKNGVSQGSYGVHEELVTPSITAHNEQVAALYEYRRLHGSADLQAYLAKPESAELYPMKKGIVSILVPQQNLSYFAADDE